MVGFGRTGGVGRGGGDGEPKEDFGSDVGRSATQKFDYGTGAGSKQEIVGRIAEMKAAPRMGQKRVEIKEKGGSHRTLEIDVPIKEAQELERKKSYKFLVEEKEKPVYAGSSSRQGSGNYSIFNAVEKPREVSDAAFRREPKRSDGRSASSNTRKYSDENR
jgi:hypothetical protein